MAQNETWLNHDLLDAVKVQYLDGNLFSMDNAGNMIGVKLTRDGVDYSGGGSVSANVIRADGTTVTVIGALSGNAATVVLPQAAYAVPGVVSIVVKLTVSGEVTTIAAVVANVYQSSTDSVVDPGTIIPSVQNLISAIETAVASIPADYSSLWTSLAPAFSTSVNYTAGQYVTYNGALYRFTTDHSAGAWNSAHVTATNLGSEINSLKSAFLYSSMLKPISVIQNAKITSDTISSGSIVSNDGTNVYVYEIKDKSELLIYSKKYTGYFFITSNVLLTAADLPKTSLNKENVATNQIEYSNTNNYKYLYRQSADVEIFVNLPSEDEKIIGVIANEISSVKQDEASSYMHENLMKTGAGITATSTTDNATIAMNGGSSTLNGNSYGRFSVTQNKYYRLIGKSNCPYALYAQYSANSFGTYIANSAVSRGLSETVNVVFKALGTMVFVSFGTYTGQLELHQISKFEFVDQLNTVNREFLDLKYRNIDASMNLIDKTTCIKAYIDANGKIIANNSYYVTDYIPVKGNNISAYVTASNNIPPFARYDANFNLLGVDTSNKYTYVSGDAFVRICFTGSYFDTAHANYGNTLLAYSDFRLSNEVYAPPTTVFVGSYDWCDYANVQQALYGITDDSASKPYIIHVCPGTYPRFTMKYTAPNVRAESARYISIIGENPDNTIFFDNKGSYMISPCDIFTNGIIENITFSVITDSEHYTPDTLNVQTSGYAMHTDFGKYRTQFINCIFRCNVGPGVGAGLFEDSLLQFDNCRFESLCDGSFGEHAQTGQGAIFVHTFSSSSKAVNQVLRINNSIAVAPYQSNGARFAVIGSSHTQYGSEYSFEFQNFGAFGNNGAQISLADPDSDLLGPYNFNNLPNVLNTAS